MEKDFIEVRELIYFKYSSIQVRLHVVDITGADPDHRYRYILTIRTCNRRDEVTEFYTCSYAAFSRFKEIVDKHGFTV